MPLAVPGRWRATTIPAMVTVDPGGSVARSRDVRMCLGSVGRSSAIGWGPVVRRIVSWSAIIRSHCDCDGSGGAGAASSASASWPDSGARCRRISHSSRRRSLEKGSSAPARTIWASTSRPTGARRTRSPASR